MDQLNPDQIKSVIDKAEVLVYKSGKVIYLQNSFGENVYLVLEGNVELLCEKNSNIVTVNSYRPISLFGYDAFAANPVRKTSARAQTDSLVVRMNASELWRIIQDDKNLLFTFTQILKGYLLMTQIGLEGRKPGETIHFIGHFFPLKQILFFLISLSGTLTLGKVISPFIFSKDISGPENIFVVFMSIFFMIVINIVPYLNWIRSQYVITDQRVIVKELSVLRFENRHEMRLPEIIGIAERTNIIGRMFYIGDLIVNSYTGILEIRNISYATVIQKILEKLQSTSSDLEKVAVQKTYDAIMANRIAMDTNATSSQDANEVPNRESWNSLNKGAGFFERLFGLKIYRGDTILFRTHWIELIKRIIIPFVLLTSFQIFLIYLSGENVSWTGNQFVLISSISLMVAFLAWLIYQFVDWRNDRFIITNDQIIDINQKPFGIEDKRTAPINRIQSIRYQRQGLVGLLFNYGTVFIRIGDDELTFDHVHNPLSVQQEIFNRMEQIKRTKEEELLANQRDQVADMIEAYHRMAQKK